VYIDNYLLYTHKKATMVCLHSAIRTADPTPITNLRCVFEVMNADLNRVDEGLCLQQTAIKHRVRQ